jgi:uncharacterized protein
MRFVRAWCLRIFCWASILAHPGLVLAQQPIPPLTGHVTDTTGTLTDAQVVALERTLTAFEARKGSQLVVLIVASTAPEDIAPFALRVAEQWKIGRKKIDDGVILVIAKNDRALRIEVGYGLEGALTDLTSHRIIDEVIVPRFKAQDFEGGITAGVERIIRVIDGEPLPEPSRLPRTGTGDQVKQFAPVLFVVALAVGSVLRAVLGRLPGALVTGGVVSVMAWFTVGLVSVALGAGLVAMLLTLFGGRGRHGWSGYYGGSGGGSAGGGGFSGGGGSFGGGGASGKW